MIAVFCMEAPYEEVIARLNVMKKMQFDDRKFGVEPLVNAKVREMSAQEISNVNGAVGTSAMNELWNKFQGSTVISEKRLNPEKPLDWAYLRQQRHTT
jgi:hypothetical protein